MSARQRLPSRHQHVGFNFRHRDGLLYRCTAARGPDGRLLEIFLNRSKAGSTAQQHADTAAILASLLMQNGVDSAAVASSVAGSAVAAAIDLAEAP